MNSKYESRFEIKYENNDFIFYRNSNRDKWILKLFELLFPPRGTGNKDRFLKYTRLINKE